MYFACEEFALCHFSYYSLFTKVFTEIAYTVTLNPCKLRKENKQGSAL